MLHYIRLIFSTFTVLLLSTQVLAAKPELRYIGSKENHQDQNSELHLADALYRSVKDNSKIFQETDLAFSLSLSDYVDLKVKWARQVHNYHPVKFGKLLPEDHSKLLVVNSIYSKIAAGSKVGPIKLGAATEYGVLFSVGQLTTPDDSLEGSPYLINQSSNKQNGSTARADISKLMLKDCKLCSSKDNFVKKTRQYLTKVWSYGIDKAEDVIQWIIAPFVDNEKWHEYNKEPLKALKQQGIFGLPVDVNVFLESDDRLAEGGILKHTSFLTFKPAVIGGELGDVIDSNASVFIRYIEEISLLKKANNKVLLQTRFIKSNGGNITFARLSTGLDLGPSYTFLDWEKEDYDLKLKQYTFEFDLNEPEAKEMLQEVLRNNYVIDFFDFDASRVDVKTPGVTFVDQIKNKAERKDASYRTKIPLINNTIHQNVFNLSQENLSSRERDFVQIKSENLLTEERSYRSIFDFFKKRDFSVRGHLLTQTAPGMGLFQSQNLADESFVITFTNVVKNKYADSQFLEELISLDKKILDGTTTNEDYLPLEHIRKKLKKETLPLNYSSVLTFKRSHLERILSRSENDLLKEAATIFLGPEHANEWVQHKSEWSRPYHPHGPRSKPPLGQMHRSKRFQCSRTWPDEFRKQMSKMHVQVKNCYDLFKWSQRLAHQLKKAKSASQVKNQIRHLNKKFDRLELLPAMQLLFARLAGGFNSNESGAVQYKSSFYTKDMLKPFEITTGDLYRYPYEIKRDHVIDIESAKNSPDRVQQVIFYVDLKSNPDSPDYYVELNTKHKFQQNEGQQMSLKMDFREQKLISRDKTIIESYFERLPEPKLIRPVGSHPYYRYFLKLNPPTRVQNQLQKLRSKKRYTILATIVNDDGYWVSEQNEIAINTPKKKEFEL